MVFCRLTTEIWELDYRLLPLFCLRVCTHLSDVIASVRGVGWVRINCERLTSANLKKKTGAATEEKRVFQSGPLSFLV